MNNHDIGKCTICGADNTAIRHLELFTTGSEGTWACDDCAIALAEFGRRMRLTATKARMQGYRAAKIVGGAKAAACQSQAGT
jgi:hypothetical protein